MIQVEGLKKSFNGLIAVNNISFSVIKGEIFGFLGPNGAGKTTTIRLLTGVLKPDKGRIYVGGIDVRKEPVRAKMNIGVIPEMGNIYMDLTPLQNMVLSGRFYGIPKKEIISRADALLHQLGLYERKVNTVRKLSKGLRQRVNIACALIHHPSLLFLDEPTAGLDVQSQRLIHGLIKQMKREGTTIFLTTHNIEEANSLCDRVGIINKGKIVVIERPEILRSTFGKIRSVEVSFQPSIDISSNISNTLARKVERIGDKWKLYTENPDTLVKYLCKFAEEQDLVIISLEICAINLEDIFVKLTETK